ncbi:hypothetical protein N9E71_02525 [Candidatus Pelagibacter sp.]|jgi:hypothetical protein|nr:hypothetical protein [Candidatus Pelagibacter sp.]
MISTLGKNLLNLKKADKKTFCIERSKIKSKIKNYSTALDLMIF